MDGSDSGNHNINLHERTVPARRCTVSCHSNWTPVWEDTMTTGRIINIHHELMRRLVDPNPVSFLEYLEENEVTQEELEEVISIYFFSNTSWGLMLIAAVGRGLDYKRNPEPSLEVIRTLIDVNPNMICAPSYFTKIVALHSALEWGATQPVIELLLKNDPSRSTIWKKDRYGNLPLHMAARNGASNTVLKYLLSYAIGETEKKEMLDTKNNEGCTPMDSSWMYSRDFSVSTFLAEERIQLVPAGIPSWNERLQGLIHQYHQLKQHPFFKGLRRDPLYRFTKFFVRLFQNTIEEIEYLNQHKPHEITLLELAVWKGYGFDDIENNDEDGNNNVTEVQQQYHRHSKWITCGAHQISYLVARYLGPDPIGCLQAEHDTIVRQNINGPAPSAT